ncbi:hypothetical protein [Deinococcus hohokamensis]|uniref:Uncharacterized protein n=1 Tax=Deinococcus hohokamensis TaxID=309883 RepID=A0ABV9IAF1_9DEIO
MRAGPGATVNWRSLALGALWVQVAALFGVSAYALWAGGFGPDGVLGALEAFLAGLVMAWWTAIFARVSLGEAVAPGDGVLRALTLAFPWLSALRGGLWLTLLLALISGAGADANPVALTALMTVWAGAVMASNAMYGALVRLAPAPGDLLARTRLLEWLNVSAALSLGMGVLNAVPIAGFSTPPTLASQLVYGLSAALDVLATLLAWQALRRAPLPPKP